MSKLGTGYLSLAKELLGGRKLVAKGRRVVSEEDVAIFLMLLKFFSLNMNADGSEVDPISWTARDVTLIGGL
jgi:hypothetical protein